MFVLAGCEPRLYRDRQVMMGTYVEVVSPDPRAAAIAFNEMKRIEKLFNLYDPDSEISRLNAAGELAASPEVMFVLRVSAELSRLTDGAFDITVGPLSRLWGFSDGKFHVPSQEEITAARLLVGADKIILNSDSNVVKLAFPGMIVDTNAIVPGYAADCAVKAVSAEGITSCLIDAGGEIRCVGDKAGKPWSIGIRSPGARGRSRRILLKNRAVATSGDYEKFFTVGGRRYQHIIDPRTGRPAETGLASVTVIAGDCLTADALATALCVSGETAVDAVRSRFPGVEVKTTKR